MAFKMARVKSQIGPEVGPKDRKKNPGYNDYLSFQIRQRGLDNCKLEDLVQDITPTARASVPGNLLTSNDK